MWGVGGWWIVAGLVLLLVLLLAMWLAFNINDYGVNDWEEESEVEQGRREKVVEEVQREERRREGQGRREEVYYVSKHSASSISNDSAISMGSPLDSSAGKSTLEVVVSPGSGYPVPTSPRPTLLTLHLPPCSIHAVRLVHHAEALSSQIPNNDPETQEDLKENKIVSNIVLPKSEL